jgi:hypothetical protein
VADHALGDGQRLPPARVDPGPAAARCSPVDERGHLDTELGTGPDQLVEDLLYHLLHVTHPRRPLPALAAVGV